MSIETLVARIEPLHQDAMELAMARQDMLTKPQGSLGRLEKLSVQIAGITGQVRPRLQNKVVTVMAGDHGVVAEGVSAFPQAVTLQMMLNFLYGGAAINVLSKHVGARVVIVDMGVATPMDAHPQLISRKVALGTGNIAQGPAMTREQAIESVLSGVEIVEAEIERGLDILATGDMGIGNTTPSAAIACVVTGKSASEIVGRGTGVDDAGLHRKIVAVENALRVNQPNPQEGLDILSKVGGFEIGGLAGAILGAAANHRPVIIDGFISTAAAIIAATIAPQVKDYLVAAHCSQELGHRLMMDWLGLTPLLDMQMRLGEGTGAVLAMSLVDASCKILDEMATFDEAGVSEKA
jgi:nicotinate-nucleotide--dimethylbenzimidazole phosphoribosyltransferase